MARLKKLTPEILRNMILKEKKNIMNESDPLVAGIDDPADVDAEEVPAGEEGRALEKDIDYIKALKIQEARLTQKLRRIKKAKHLISERLLKRI